MDFSNIPFSQFETTIVLPDKSDKKFAVAQIDILSLKGK